MAVILGLTAIAISCSCITIKVHCDSDLGQDIGKWTWATGIGGLVTERRDSTRVIAWDKVTCAVKHFQHQCTHTAPAGCHATCAVEVGEWPIYRVHYINPIQVWIRN